MGHPIGDFVDAGDGKECADSKLKDKKTSYAWFDYDMADVQCQATIFGGSADNGYARLLQPYVGESSKKKRVILVEGLPFVKELAGLKDNFLVACFPDVFRHAKLPPRRVSFSTTPPSTPVPNALSYAAITNPADTAAIRPIGANDPSVTVPARRNYPLLKNSRG
ncbi:hypothetical protein MMC25_006044 [Agyrium rufum]|nr:hypothetical protein [Agyrium rufum]